MSTIYRAKHDKRLKSGDLIRVSPTLVLAVHHCAEQSDGTYLSTCRRTISNPHKQPKIHVKPEDVS